MRELTADNILELIQQTIAKWHKENENRPINAVIVTDEMKKIRPFGQHRDEIEPVIHELTVTNTEMWHEEDKIRSEDDAVVLRAIRNVNPLNQHRNDLIEEIDEIFIDKEGQGSYGNNRKPDRQNEHQ